MKYRIISDTHFGHQMLVDIGDRKTGYEKKIYNSISKIQKEDILIHLGDILIGDDKLKHDQYIQSIQCKKILVKGNHDTKTTNWYYNNGWDFVCDSYTLKHLGKEIMFVHIPTDETAERTSKKDNRIVIHGHYHKYGRRDKGKLIRHILFSCEYENMQARTIEYMVNLL